MRLGLRSLSYATCDGTLCAFRQYIEGYCSWCLEMTRHTVDRQEKNLLARVVFRTACFVDRLSLEPRGGILQGWICDSCKGRTVPSRERKNTMARFFQHVLLFSVGYRPEWTTPNTEPHKVRAVITSGFVVAGLCRAKSRRRSRRTSKSTTL